MKRIFVYAVGLLAMMATTLASAADLYQMNMVVKQAGVVISKPVIRLEANKDASLTLTPDPVVKNRDIRLEIRIAQAPQDPANLVTVHMTVFDKARGEWTLRSEPVVKALLGSQVMLTVDAAGITRPALPIEVSFQAKKVTSENAAMLGSQFPNERQMATASVVMPMGQPPMRVLQY